MKMTMIFVLLAALLLQGCRRENSPAAASASQTDSLPAAAKVTKEYVVFQAQSDSILCRLDSQIVAFNKTIEEPGRQRHIAKKRRDALQAGYRLDKLRERLDKHSQSYREAVEGLNRTERGNPRFIREYREDLAGLDSMVIKLWNDTLQ